MPRIPTRQIIASIASSDALRGAMIMISYSVANDE